MIREGFFKHPNERTIEDVVKALEAQGLSTKGKEGKIASSLARRVKKRSPEKIQGIKRIGLLDRIARATFFCTSALALKYVAVVF